MQGAREQADQAIGADVTTVDSTLNQWRRMSPVEGAAAQGQSSAPFVDTQNTLLSTLSKRAIKV